MPLQLLLRILPLFNSDADSSESAWKLLRLLLYFFLYCIVTQILLNQHVNYFSYYNCFFLYCIVTQILRNQHVNCFNYWLLHLSWLYCLTDSTTFIQSARRCRMGKFWRVLVIYTSWVTLSLKDTITMQLQVFKVKAVFYCKPTLMRLLSWTSWPFIRKFMHPKRGGSPKVWLTLRAQPT